ncbi:MAG: ABC transporter permease subunit [Desulfobacterales bacterium]|jgi:spermidine/putrescine transport system permease protein|nr:ABC transporter permease subunit [Desulfobacteraceae bacterium]MDY0312383.1 ABC transporter permease subunit [Desulfobacterales bacterium]
MTDRSPFKTAVVAVVAFWILVFVLLPNLLVLAASVLARDEVRFIRPGFTLAHYRALMSTEILGIFVRSIAYAAGTTAICLAVGYPFAFLLARSSARKLLLMLVVIPFWTSSLVRTYALIIVLKANGLINTLLLETGLIQQPLPLLYSNTAVFIGLVYTLLPFMILPLYAAMEKFDPALMEAGYDLGASRLQVLRHILLPVTLPGIIAGATMVFLPALGLFYVPDLLGGARSMLLGNLIKNQFLAARNWPLGAAASMTLTLLMGLLLWAYFVSVRRYGDPREALTR